MTQNQQFLCAVHAGCEIRSRVEHVEGRTLLRFETVNPVSVQEIDGQVYVFEAKSKGAA